MTRIGRAFAALSLAAGSLVGGVIAATGGTGVKLGPESVTVKLARLVETQPVYTDFLPAEASKVGKTALADHILNLKP